MTAASEGYIIDAQAPPRGRLRGLVRRRGLLWSFTLRELQVRYRQAALGVGWALLQPAALTIVTTLVFHRFLRVATDGTAPYPVFVYTGLLAWTFFHTAVTAAVPTLVNNAGLVRKIWFPRETLPLATVAAALLDLAVALLLWAALLVAYAVPPSPAWLWTPVLLIVLVAFTASLALLGAAVNVRFRDVKHALPLLLQMLFFATPIVYPLSAAPAGWRGILGANPLAAVVTGLREAVLDGRAPDAGRTGLAAAVTALLLLGSWHAFVRADRRFADIV
jgi:ABC-type polysaccharide/polyol phosphate export permease